MPTQLFVVRGSVVTPASVVRDLDVWITSSITMSYRATKIIAGCFAVLHQLRVVRRSLSRESLISLVVVLVLSQFDYCNSVLPENSSIGSSPSSRRWPVRSFPLVVKATSRRCWKRSIGYLCTNASSTNRLCVLAYTGAIAAQHRFTWLATINRCPASSHANGFIPLQQPRYWSLERIRLWVTDLSQLPRPTLGMHCLAVSHQRRH
jgi:hypothetical protein